MYSDLHAVRAVCATTQLHMNVIHSIQGATDREAIIDAFIRWVTSSDEGDRDLLISALTPDVVVDFTSLQECGIALGVLQGRETVVDSLIRRPGRGETTHMLGNFRVQVDGDRAQAECLCRATHFTRKESSSSSGNADFTITHRYRGDLARVAGGRSLARLKIDLYWTSGLGI